MILYNRFAWEGVGAMRYLYIKTLFYVVPWVSSIFACFRSVFGVFLRKFEDEGDRPFIGDKRGVDGRLARPVCEGQNKVKLVCEI